jgi:hypothetical protein
MYIVVFTLLLHEVYGIETGTNAPFDSDAHLHSRWADDSIEWSPTITEDVNVLHYDRPRGRVLGFDVKTGKVFVQDNKLVVAHRHPHSSVQIVQHKGHNSYNFLLYESSRHELMLRPRHTTSYVSTDRKALWVVHFATELMVVVHPHTDERMKCNCNLRKPKGTMRGVSLYLGEHCKPVVGAAKHEHSAGFVIGNHVKAVSSPRQDSFCLSLSQTLRGMKFLSFVRAADLSGGTESNTTLDVLKPTQMVHRNMMNGVSKEGRAHMAQKAKFVIKLVYATQRVVAALWTYIVGIIKFSDEYMTQLKRTPIIDDKQVPMQFPTRVHRLPTLRDNNDTSLVVTCNTNVSSVLRLFLAHPKTFLTPESTNMTRVFRSLGEHVQQKALCYNAIMDRIESMFKCLLRRPNGDSTTPEHLNTLNGMMGAGHLLKTTRKGVGPAEVADQIVKVSEDLALEMIGRSKQLALMANSVPRFGGSEHNIVFLEDIFCCATEGRTPVVNRSAPLCIPKEKRVIVDTMMEMNLTK